MLRKTLLAVLLIGVSAGCQPGSNRLPTTTASFETRQPSATTTVPRMASPTMLPSLTPTFAVTTPTADPRAYVAAAEKVSVWDKPENENQYWHLQTELLLGEKVLVLERDGDWSRIAAVKQPSSKDKQGYPGWVRSDKLVPGWLAATQQAVVMGAQGELRAEPDGKVTMTVSLDTRLPVEAVEGEWVQVGLPDGSRGWLAAGESRLVEDPQAPFPTEGLFDLAESLEGVPYKWGGTTTAALDCSGFTYRVMHAYGILLPRDASDQALAGEQVNREAMKKGDLIFTADEEAGPVSHVAFYWGDGMILDASGGKGVSRRPLQALLAVNTYVTARRVLP